jgi:uroporphyrinogen decarboxylase
MQLTSYDRVKIALEHKEPDHIPLDIGGAMVTGINIQALRNLKKYLGLKEEVKIWDTVTQLAHTGEDIIQTLMVDVKNVSPQKPFNSGLERDLGLVGNYYRIIDEFGIGWQMPVDGGHYYDLYLSPLANATTVKEIENYPWPDPLDPGRFRDLKEKVHRVVHEEKKAYVMERMSPGMWEHATWMRGPERFFTDMILNENLVQAIMEKELELKMMYWGKCLEIIGEETMVVSTADDLGAQNTLLVSLEMYKRLIWPYHKRLFDFIKKKAKGKVYIFFHSDGAIMEAIPLLIEAGIDILNPFQVNCKGMDTKMFKKLYGKELTIWGGSCDPVTLEFGTTEDVRKETKRCIEDLAPGGGYIFAPIHIIQEGVPPQNIMAWWETFHRYGLYR